MHNVPRFFVGPKTHANLSRREKGQEEIGGGGGQLNTKACGPMTIDSSNLSLWEVNQTVQLQFTLEFETLRNQKQIESIN